MWERDWLVAGVAALLGLSMIWSGWTNNTFAFQLWLPRLLDTRFGRPRARVLLVLLGAGVISLGGYVGLGQKLWGE